MSVSQTRVWFQSVGNGVWVYIDNLWAKLEPTHSEPALILTDRLGLVHRIRNTQASTQRRYVNALSLEVIDADVMISGTLTEGIVTVDQGNKYFYLTGTPNYTGIFRVGLTFTVTGSTGNNGTYTVAAVFQDSANTRITTVEAIPHATANGSVNLDIPLPEFIDYWCVQQDSVFYVYHKEVQESSAGISRTWLRAYKCYLKQVPGAMLGTLQRYNRHDIPGGIPLVCVEDGVFSAIGTNPASGYTGTTRPS